ncbi:hypothetical protein [Bradyrhizobium sp. USDA 3364]
MIETRHDAAFALEAASLAHATELLQTSWLAAALDDFHRRQPHLSQRCAPWRIREATAAEAALFRDLADEFADGSNRFLVAELPDEF